MLQALKSSIWRVAAALMVVIMTGTATPALATNGLASGAAATAAAPSKAVRRGMARAGFVMVMRLPLRADSSLSMSRVAA